MQLNVRHAVLMKQPNSCLPFLLLSAPKTLQVKTHAVSKNHAIPKVAEASEEDRAVCSYNITNSTMLNLNVGWVHGFIGISLLSDEIGNFQIVGLI
jgi:hypothetical protein